MAKAILRVGKHTSTRSVGGMGRHMNRTRKTPNADPERQHLNMTWLDDGHGWKHWKDRSPPNLNTQLNERLEDFKQRGGTVRNDSVLTIELMLSASPDWFKQASQEQFYEWIKRNTQWVAETFGKKNVLQIVLHRDETTPHLHVMVIPEIEMVETRGRKRKDGMAQAPKEPKPALAASRWLDGKEKLGALQDSYAAAMSPLGLERGLKGSGAQHRTIRSYYAAANAVMGAGSNESLIPNPPPLPEPTGVMERMFGYIPRGDAEAANKEVVKKARAVERALQKKANDAAAAAIEAQLQHRRLLDQFEAFGGAKILDEFSAVDKLRLALEKQLVEAKKHLELVKLELEAAAAMAADGMATMKEELESANTYAQDLKQFSSQLENRVIELQHELYGEPEQTVSRSPGLG